LNTIKDDDGYQQKETKSTSYVCEFLVWP